jgi:Cupin-like domain
MAADAHCLAALEGPPHSRDEFVQGSNLMLCAGSGWRKSAEVREHAASTSPTLKSGAHLELVHDANRSSPLPHIVEGPAGERFLDDYLRAGVPVQIKGLVADWPAVDAWTPGYLAGLTAAMGDLDVPYRRTPADMPWVDVERLEHGSMSLLKMLGEFERSPMDGEEIYVPGLDLPRANPLAGDIDRPALLSGRTIYATSVFLGRNTKCIGHYHAKTQALLCQVQGVKRIWMYPPAVLKHLHLFPVWSSGFFRSQVNFYGDHRAFSRVAEAAGLLFELHPGDALFIPLHWLHVPEGIGWNISVTHWWRPALREWPWSATTARTLLAIGIEGVRRLRTARTREH